ncbi:MAG: radical SAM protein [Clostridia bacterium]|nr:radical SAM protein [Clostridia bacterium]
MEICLHKYTSDNSVILLNSQSERWIKVNREKYEKLDEGSKKKLFESYGLTKTFNEKKQFRSVYLFLTHHCNMACEFCFLQCSPDIEIEKDFDTEKIMKYYDLLCSSPDTKLVVTGGEPLSRPDIKDILKSLSEKVGKERIILQTNGLLLNDEKLGQIKDYIGCIEMSIENVVRDERLQATMEKRYAAINATGCVLSFSYVIDSDSEEYLKAALELADRYDAYFQMRFVEPIGNGAGYSLDMWENQDRLMKKSYLTFLDYVIANNGFERRYSSVIDNALIPRQKCGGFGEVAALHPNGDVFPCGNIVDKKMLLANLEENETIDKTYYDRDDVKSRFVTGEKKECLNCDYLYFCNGICGAIDRRYEHFAAYKKSTCRMKKALLYFGMFVKKDSWSREEYFRNYRAFLMNDSIDKMVKRDVEKICI